MVGLDVSVLIRATIESRGASSMGCYASGWDKWRAWCKLVNRPTWPVTETDLCLCGCHYTYKGASVSVANNVYSGVVAFVEVFGGSAGHLTGSVLLKNVRGYVTRHAQVKGRERDPLLLEHVQKIFRDVNWEETVNVRDFVSCLVAWHGFLRYSEPGGLMVDDVKFNGDHVDLFLKKSKTDRNGVGHHVVIPKLGVEMDPYTILEFYVKFMGFDQFSAQKTSVSFLFPAIKLRKMGKIAIIDSRAVPYNVARISFLSLLQKSHIKLDRPGLHSIRVGAATEYTARGASSEVVAHQGRWRTVSSRMKYQRIRTQQLVEVRKIFEDKK